MMKTICYCGHARERHSDLEEDNPCKVCGCENFEDAASDGYRAVHAALIILSEIRDSSQKAVDPLRQQRVHGR